MAATTVELPSLGESVLEGVVGRWLVKVGQSVEVDQPIAEITTDKVDTELPSPIAGVVQEILVEEGATVPVGGGLLRIDPEGTATATADSSPAEASSVPSAASTPPVAAALAAAKSTPVARKMAEEQGVDLSTVAGSGVSGRIQKGDVVAAATAKPPVVAEAPLPPVAAPSAAASVVNASSKYAYVPRAGDNVIPMSPLRKLVSEHMVLSKRISPHVGTVTEVDLSAVSKLRDANKGAFKKSKGYSLTYLPFAIYATVRALKEFPQLNAAVLEGAIVLREEINISIAVETEKGLVVPVIRNADHYSLSGIADAIQDLSVRARSKRLAPDEMRGGSFTVSNPGRKGNLYGFAIINQPQVGIIRLGELVKRPVVRTVDGEDAIVIRPMMHIALSYDHRAVDGAPANGFLYRVREILEAGEIDL